MANLVPTERIENVIFLLRGHKVMLDSHRAQLYGVETRMLLQAVSRNHKRFPEDVMFQLSGEEYGALRSQTVISKKGRGGRRYREAAGVRHCYLDDLTDLKGRAVFSEPR